MGSNMTDRIGNWMQTNAGLAFYPLDPVPEEICIEDIAHSLSLLCRFGGHCSSFYSVAQHSVLVSCGIENALLNKTEITVFNADLALWGLLHDASEAYAGDVIWPVKRAPEMEGYRAIETRLQNAVCDRFTLPREEPAIVKHFDLVALATEKRDLMGGRGDRTEGASLEAAAARARTGSWHSDVVEPFAQKIVPWNWELAQSVFLDRFRVLTAIRFDGGSSDE